MRSTSAQRLTATMLTQLQQNEYLRIKLKQLQQICRSKDDFYLSIFHQQQQISKSIMTQLLLAEEKIKQLIRSRICNNWKQQYENLVGSIQSYVKDVNYLIDSYSVIKQRLQQKTYKNNDLYQYYSNTLKQCGKKFDQAQLVIEQLNQQIHNYKQTIIQLDQLIQQKVSIIETQSIQINDLSDKLVTKQVLIQQNITKFNQVINQQNKIYKKQREFDEKIIQEYKQKNKKILKQNSALLRSLDQMKKIVDGLQNDMQNNEQNNHEQNHQLNKNQQKLIQSLIIQIQCYKIENNKLLQQVQTYSYENELLNEQIKRLQQDNRFQRKNSNYLQKFKGQMNRLNSLSKLQIQTDNHNSTNENNKKQVIFNQTTPLKQKQQINSLNNNNINYYQINKHESNNKIRFGLINQLKYFKKANNQLEDQNNRLISLNKQLEQNNLQKLNELNKYKMKLQQKNQQIVRLMRRKQQVEQDCEQYKMQIANKCQKLKLKSNIINQCVKFQKNYNQVKQLTSPQSKSPGAIMKNKKQLRIQISSNDIQNNQPYSSKNISYKFYDEAQSYHHDHSPLSSTTNKMTKKFNLQSFQQKTNQNNSCCSPKIGEIFTHGRNNFRL